ncbi:hypothetical protein GQ55_7G273000 [Panicum hallii var. hallii]|uniref:Uncharacterized protein n=1 Tax=Panicum hallii var. hallii TaxID=1504633 RepID=A0A2T7CZJ4_9POAL|nr:hypothetical protein GQ55_7G273000 [Panicum hallii var. hallii]
MTSRGLGQESTTLRRSRPVFVLVQAWRPRRRRGASSSLPPRSPIPGRPGEHLCLRHRGATVGVPYIGEWLLPFRGRACYARELGALVGICHYGEGPGASAAATCSRSLAMPAWRLGARGRVLRRGLRRPRRRHARVIHGRQQVLPARPPSGRRRRLGRPAPPPPRGGDDLLRAQVRQGFNSCHEITSRHLARI